MVKEIKEEGLEYLYYEGELYCIILRDNYRSGSVSFFTPNSFSQQLGFLPHRRGDIIKPHRHQISKREILYTQEVLFIKKGKVRVNFYNKDHRYAGSEEIAGGDIILLCGGGHGFEFLEDTIMVEVKQGPYMGEDDKVRFNGVEGKE